jgi:hypothetical protein
MVLIEGLNRENDIGRIITATLAAVRANDCEDITLFTRQCGGPTRVGFDGASDAR